jgi:hypothetical protein
MTALRRAAFQAVREPQGAVRRDLANVQFHHRMNLPNGVARHVLATVALSFPPTSLPRRNTAKAGPVLF